MQAPAIIRGRGAQIQTVNRFAKQTFIKAHWEAIDEEDLSLLDKTEYIEVFPKTIINEVKSEDLPLEYSLNPYQGCEHGCLYCYARDTHNYWGYNSGADFEQKIMVKLNAPQVLEQTFQKPNWKVKTIMLSGNTDCYQPAERRYGITRKLLELCLQYKHPVGIITKNSLIERDLDLLKELNKYNLVHVSISITTLNEDLRSVLEPRTVTSKRKLKTVETLSQAGIPVHVMIAPIIPGLNSHELFDIAKAAHKAGAKSISHAVVRLNGSIGTVFTDWIKKVFPDRADKVIHGIEELHGGKLNDSRTKIRMQGEGKTSEVIRQMMRVAQQRFFPNPYTIQLNTESFVRTRKGQLSLF
ncbi:MAG: PA0069 family radical SAM protein [Bacteroidia bacterium]|nr:PA0069 family radical SAM protein [Bacteroidia bacterium]